VARGAHVRRAWVLNLADQSRPCRLKSRQVTFDHLDQSTRGAEVCRDLGFDAFAAQIMPCELALNLYSKLT